MEKILAIATLLFFTTAVVDAEIFKWVDENGGVHYGDKATQNSTQLHINEKTTKTVKRKSQSREERRRKLTQAMTEDRLEKQKQKAETKKQKKDLKRKCLFAKDRLKSYKRAGSLYDLDKSGNRYNLSEKQHNKAIKNLEKDLKKHCK